MQVLDLDLLSYGSGSAPKQPAGELFREHGHLRAEAHIVCIDIPAAQQQEVSDDGVVLVHAVDLDVFLPALHTHLREYVHDAGGRDDPTAKLLPHGLDIGDLHEIRVHLGVVGVAGFVLRENQVRTHRPDLVQDELARGGRDGDHQNYGRVADHQAERCQDCSDLVRPEGLQAKTEGLRV